MDVSKKKIGFLLCVGHKMTEVARPQGPSAQRYIQVWNESERRWHEVGPPAYDMLSAPPSLAPASMPQYVILQHPMTLSAPGAGGRPKFSTRLFRWTMWMLLVGLTVHGVWVLAEQGWGTDAANGYSQYMNGVRVCEADPQFLIECPQYLRWRGVSWPAYVLYKVWDHHVQEAAQIRRVAEFVANWCQHGTICRMHVMTLIGTLMTFVQMLPIAVSGLCLLWMTAKVLWMFSIGRFRTVVHQRIE